MIEKQGHKFFIVCDNCYAVSDEGYDTFEEAAENKGLQGFKSKKYSNGWVDLCKDCQED